MRDLNEILTEFALNLDHTEQAILLSMKIAPSPQMAYAVVRGAQNASTASGELQRKGYIRVDHKNSVAELTDKGNEFLEVTDLLTDEFGKPAPSERGKKILRNYRQDTGEWKTYESFKYLL